jgi:hypothetical protein
MQQHTALGFNPAIQVRLREDLWSAIETFRRNEPDIPTRPEAVRRLVQRALDTGFNNSMRILAPASDQSAGAPQRSRPTITKSSRG